MRDRSKLTTRECVTGASLLAAAALMIASPAGAVDGVLEINQTCATRTGCFAGDTAGFPVTISAPGSYRLTGELSAPGTAVEVGSGHVTLDLNGFRVSGASSPGSRGVDATLGGSATSHVTVRNGSVTGFDVGIFIGMFGRIENLSVSDCGTGISIGTEGPSDTLVRDSTIVENSNKGVAGSGVIEGNLFASNGVNVNGPFSSLGENLCDEAPCSTPELQLRGFYLSQNYVTAGNAPSACAQGYHMASIYEIWDVSHLRYDTTLGAYWVEDSGSGPPAIEAGWVHSGGYADYLYNCYAFTDSDPGTYGITASLMSTDDLQHLSGLTPWIAGEGSAPWRFFSDECNAQRTVWCIQD